MLSVYADFETLEIQFDKLTGEIFNTIDRQAERFFIELEGRNPVDTGDMKSSWTFTRPQYNDASWVWTAKNAMDYSDIITQGRRKVGNRWYGSRLGWGNGGVSPLLEKMSNRIWSRTNELKI